MGLHLILNLGMFLLQSQKETVNHGILELQHKCIYIKK